MVDWTRKDYISLFLPDIDFEQSETLFNLTNSLIKNINKKLREIISQNGKSKLVVETRMTSKRELYLLLTDTLILPWVINLLILIFNGGSSEQSGEVL